MQNKWKFNLKSLIIFAFILTIFVYLSYLWLPLTPRKIKIGATYMTLNNSFYGVINEELKKKVNIRGDILYTRNPGLNVTKQCQEIDDFIAKKVDVIVINPVDGESHRLAKTLFKAKKAGIKIIEVDSQLKNKQIADCSIVSDNYQAGKLIASNLIKKAPRANIVLLEHGNALSVKERYQGVSDTLKSQNNYQNNYHILTKIETLGQTEVTLPKVKHYFALATTANTIVALDDQSAVGALAALDALQLNRPINVYGIDGSATMKRLLETNPNAQATVAQSPINLGKKTANACYQLALNKPVKRNIIVPVYLLTQKNIQNYDVSGWQ